ncbi:hypothetical protein [Stakelama pacifica]|uniref:Regulatory protein FlaEY n=1 Tax=Stakelama pacifica TaxID=517720 RepID=A0A4R6FKS3_9SPHN|nr:hypothetical protein [Stakelama pacifica]TDN81184.1 hypothetical protein EV664_108126 [Stakelama pacifica]GGO96999.1 regulatory protein FlaEY [Stakelama pacifica]
MMNINSGLAGLALLGGNSSLFSFGSGGLSGGLKIESRAVRNAREQFTLPETTPPWKMATATKSLYTQVEDVMRMRTVIDKPAGGARTLPDDVQTAFTAYKALDRLRALAELAAKPGAGESNRADYDKAFSKGLVDLENFLSTAPSDKLSLAFDQPVRRAQSATVDGGTGNYSPSFIGKKVTKERSDVLSGLTGTEKFQVKLSRGSASDTITVDLSQLTDPPTLDNVSTLINNAIAAIPYRDENGNTVTQADGTTEPKWKVSFEPTKVEEGWTLKANRQSIEQVSVDQIDAPDAVLVATGMTGLETATSTRVMRIDDPSGDMSRKTLATIAANDRLKPEETVKTTADAMVTDADGFGYVLGTTSGDLGSQRLAGDQDLYLTKMDSLGNVVWQHSLGAAGSASGAALSIADNGDVVVAGNVRGAFEGTNSDGDMLVARYDGGGNEKFATLIRKVGTETATSVVAAADGSVYVGGQASSEDGGDAYVVKVDSAGHIAARQSYDTGTSEKITSLAMGADGKLLALTREGENSSLRFLDTSDLSSETGRVDLGTADARALAVDASGNIAIGGTTVSALGGTQINGLSGSGDGFVARVAGDGSGLAVTYLGTEGTDQVDSLVYSGNTLYVGGRTNGTIGAEKSGPVDGFVARLDATSGAIGKITQFGTPGQRTEPVRLVMSSGGTNSVGELGFGRGAITPGTSMKLTTATSLRGGDSFQMRVDGGALRTITIDDDETLSTLMGKVQRIVGRKGTVTTPRGDGGAKLTISPKSGVDIEFVAGPEGRDGLKKLGLPTARVQGYDIIDPKAPAVRPGGTFGLKLNMTLSLKDMKSAAEALDAINSAISVSQTGYRSLYWDDLKAARVEPQNFAAGGGSARENAQLANYQAALDRLSSSSASTSILGF